jgi:hypothetical protein
MRAIGSAVLLLALFSSGCGSPRPYPREPDDNHMFGPVSLRIHPTFTQVKDWTGHTKPDGVEAVIELLDQFGDPTRASGKVMFELWSYRQAQPDVKGQRLATPWVAALLTPREQAAHWSSAVRGYSFQLADPNIQTGRRYVLTAQFDLSGGRLFDQLVLEPLKTDDAKPKREHRTVRAPAETPGR